jgi:glutathione S-transferase
MKPPQPAMQAALREFGRSAVTKRHEQLEAMIGDVPFLVGDRPTLADALLAGVARWLEFHQIFDAGKYPRLYRLRQRIESDAAFIFARAIEAGESPAGVGAMRAQIPLEEVLSRIDLRNS